MNPSAKFGLNLRSRLADYKEHTHTQCRMHITNFTDRVIVIYDQYRTDRKKSLPARIL